MLSEKIISSDELTGINLSGNRLTEYDCYLFQTLSSRVVFVIIEEEMAQLNDLLLVTTNSIHKYIEGLHVKLEKMNSESSWLDNGIEDFELPKWNHSLEFLFPAASLLSCQMFFEKSLKYLCTIYVPTPPRQQKGKSKIHNYLNLLEGSFSFNTPKSSLDYIIDCQKLRNELAHGDWEVASKSIASANLPLLLDSMREVFEAIEIAIDNQLN